MLFQFVPAARASGRFKSVTSKLVSKLSRDLE